MKLKLKLKPIQRFFLSNSRAAEWRMRERRTARLIRACFATLRSGTPPSADFIYWLCKLTWITKYTNRAKGIARVSDKYKWSTKLPAICAILGLPPDCIDETLIAVTLAKRSGINAKEATELVEQDTGIANTYTAYRNSVRQWIKTNIRTLSPLLRDAYSMRTDADGRKIVSRISMLAGIPDAAAVKKLAPEKMLTPVIACLDPRKRFPIINGGNVEHAISALGLRTARLTDQFDALIAFIGPTRCADGLELDTLIDWKGAGILTLFPKPVMSSGQHSSHNVPIKKRDLDLKDEADVKTISHAGSATMRRIHNQMTNAMQAIVSARHRITEGTSPVARYDALIENYANNGRDLLVEAKSSNDIAAIRLAIGQLIDYRRFIPKRYTTDLAVLLPSKPDQHAIELLAEAGVHHLWFSDQKMRSLKSSCGLQ